MATLKDVQNKIVAVKKTQQITKVINKMKQYPKSIYKSYVNEGVVSLSTHVA